MIILSIHLKKLKYWQLKINIFVKSYQIEEIFILLARTTKYFGHLQNIHMMKTKRQESS